MQQLLLKSLSDLAQKRSTLMREEGQILESLSRDLKREARRLEDRSTLFENSAPIIRKPHTERSANDERLFVGILDAAHMMGIGRSSLYNEINASRIKVRKCGRRTLIAVADIKEWFDGLPSSDGFDARE